MVFFVTTVLLGFLTEDVYNESDTLENLNFDNTEEFRIDQKQAMVAFQFVNVDYANLNDTDSAIRKVD